MLHFKHLVMWQLQCYKPSIITTLRSLCRGCVWGCGQGEGGRPLWRLNWWRIGYGNWYRWVCTCVGEGGEWLCYVSIVIAAVLVINCPRNSMPPHLVTHDRKLPVMCRYYIPFMAAVANHITYSSAIIHVYVSLSNTLPNCRKWTHNNSHIVSVPCYPWDHPTFPGLLFLTTTHISSCQKNRQ